MKTKWILLGSIIGALALSVVGMTIQSSSNTVTVYGSLVVTNLSLGGTARTNWPSGSTTTVTALAYGTGGTNIATDASLGNHF